MAGSGPGKDGSRIGATDNGFCHRAVINENEFMLRKSFYQAGKDLINKIPESFPVGRIQEPCINSDLHFNEGRPVWDLKSVRHEGRNVAFAIVSGVRG